MRGDQRPRPAANQQAADVRLQRHRRRLRRHAPAITTPVACRRGGPADGSPQHRPVWAGVDPPCPLARWGGAACRSPGTANGLGGCFSTPPPLSSACDFLALPKLWAAGPGGALTTTCTPTACEQFSPEDDGIGRRSPRISGCLAPRLGGYEVMPFVLVPAHWAGRGARQPMKPVGKPGDLKVYLLRAWHHGPFPGGAAGGWPASSRLGRPRWRGSPPLAESRPPTAFGA